MMKYTVYKTVNLINGKYYFGVHKTENPNDDYLGSGTYIKRAVAKHGKENFRKDVLFIFSDARSAFMKEDELIQCYRGFDPLCMNLRKGGSGGFDWINKNGLAVPVKAAKASHKAHAPGYYKRISLIYAERIRKEGLSPETREKLSGRKTWVGRKHTESAKQKMSKAGKKRTGSKNSQFGTCWITKDGVNRKIPIVNLFDFLSLGWGRGRVT